MTNGDGVRFFIVTIWTPGLRNWIWGRFQNTNSCCRRKVKLISDALNSSEHSRNKIWNFRQMGRQQWGWRNFGNSIRKGISGPLGLMKSSFWLTQNVYEATKLTISDWDASVGSHKEANTNDDHGSLDLKKYGRTPRKLHFKVSICSTKQWLELSKAPTAAHFNQATKAKFCRNEENVNGQF